MSDLKFTLRLFRFNHHALNPLLFTIFEIYSLIDLFGFEGLRSPNKSIKHGRLAAARATYSEYNLLILRLNKLFLQVIDDDDEAYQIAFELLQLLLIVSVNLDSEVLYSLFHTLNLHIRHFDLRRQIPIQTLHLFINANTRMTGHHCLHILLGLFFLLLLHLLLLNFFTWHRWIQFDLRHFNLNFGCTCCVLVISIGLKVDFLIV